MPKRNRSLHGSTPEKSKTVLLLIDVINDFKFPKAAALLRFALPAARRIAALKRRAARAGIPVIYINDNFGRWRSDFVHQVEHCRRQGRGSREIVEMLQPTRHDYSVLKPKHSGFFCTSLDILLEHLAAEKLILAGFATDICVLHTANDAFMRDFKIVIPRDCVAAESAEANRYALAQMRRHLRAKVCHSANVRFARVR